MKKIKKYLSLLMISTLGIVGTINAQEVPVMNIDEWAVAELNEGEKYGIYPITWYYGDFKGPLSNELNQQLIENTAMKIAQIENVVLPEYVPTTYEGVITRNDVVNQLARLIGETDGVAYFEQNKLMNGRKEGQALEKSCTVQEAAILATRFIDHFYQLNDAGSKGFMWQATKGSNTVYLMGSIHTGDYKMYPLDKEVKEAFKASDILYVEANVIAPTGQEVYVQKATYQDGTTLDAYIPEDLYKRTVEVGETFGVVEEKLRLYKPWTIANELGALLTAQSEDPVEAQMAALLGVDSYFILDAMVANKPIVELEGVAYQTELFDSLSMPYQIEYLESIVTQLENMEQMEGSDGQQSVDDWKAFWREGDISGFAVDYAEELSYSAEDDEIAQMLFGERDKNMTLKIKELLESETPITAFVVVGAGHLAQDNMVIDQLIEAGYTVDVYNQ